MGKGREREKGRGGGQKWRGEMRERKRLILKVPKATGYKLTKQNGIHKKKWQQQGT